MQLGVLELTTFTGYRHDTYSSWHPLFVAGAAYPELGGDLHRHGLEYRNSDGWAIASVADDGRLARAHRDPEQTVGENVPSLIVRDASFTLLRSRRA